MPFAPLAILVVAAALAVAIIVYLVVKLWWF